MKFLSGLIGLIFAISLSSVRALPPPEHAPSSSASPSPKMIVLPIPKDAPSRGPDVIPTQSFSVPKPQPARFAPPPPAPPRLPRASTSFDQAQVLKAIPVIEVWRGGAKAAQAPARHGRQLGRGYIAGSDPVMVQLHFNPSQAGRIVAVTPSRGVSFDPPTALLRIRPTGDCALTVKLDETFHEGFLTFYCDGVASLLHLSHAPLAVVASLEASSAEAP